MIFRLWENDEILLSKDGSILKIIREYLPECKPPIRYK